VTVRVTSVPIGRLTTEDRIMLRGNEGWPQEIGALAIPDGPPCSIGAAGSGPR
jgi:hypothetical protein